MKIKLLLLILFILQVFHVLAQVELKTAVEELLLKPDYKTATIGLSFIDLEDGRALFEMNENKLMIPASVLKIVTTASAIEILGPDYQFKTKIGYEGEIKNNILDGNLIILGGGDPTLGSIYFQDTETCNNFLNIWIQEIKSFGINKIIGNVIFDASDYDTENIPPTWIWEDVGNYYGAGASAFSVYDNFFEINFKTPKRSGELSEIISTNPKIEGLQMKNEVKSSDINKDLAYVFGSPFDKKRIVRGTLPKNKNRFIVKASLPQPEEILAADFISSLAETGVFVSGEIKFEKTDKNKFKGIYTHTSPRLMDIAKVINHKSVNLFAEHYVRQIAYEQTGYGSREKGLEIISQFWFSKQIPGEHFFMEDGSGLSHFNAISPVQLNFILNYMFNNSASGLNFQNTFPSAGFGTLSSFSTEFFHDNSLQAKSGSMTRVRCYSGYLTTESKKKIVFSVMVNHFNGSGSKLSKEIENLLHIVKFNY